MALRRHRVARCVMGLSRTSATVRRATRRGAIDRGTTEYARAVRLISHGPYARHHWFGGVLGGVVLPGILLALPVGALWPVAGVLALVGLFIEEDTLVRAGQALPIS